MNQSRCKHLRYTYFNIPFFEKSIFKYLNIYELEVYILKKSIEAIILGNTNMYSFDPYENERIQIVFNPVKTCPRCGASTNCDELEAFFIPEDDFESGYMFIICFCTNCEECYLEKYHVKKTKDYYKADNAIEISPIVAQQKDFDESIRVLSPRFIKIYNQALQAEKMNLDEICGMGYRKAVEILIKDYSIKFNKKETEKIIKMPLSQVIEKYIEYNKIRQMAKVSSWLGNDETHYSRKHKDYNLNDLKRFIQATLGYIQIEMSYDYSKELTNKDNKNN